MIQATVNNKTFEVESENDEITINGEKFEWDLSELSENRFHIIKDNKSYAAEIVERDEIEKSIAIKVNNHIYTVSVKDKMDLLLEKLGMDNLESQVANDIKAPMPGLIFNIMVEVGTEVKKGDSVLILEAMKMENMIKSTSDGTVSAIHVTKGDSVEKNSLLISF